MKSAPSVLIFFAVLIIHAVSPIDTVRDSRWCLPVAMSLIQEGNITLDEYRASIPPGDYCIREIGGHPYNAYPLGPSVLAVPFVWVATVCLKAAHLADLEVLLRQQAVARLEVAIASFFVALAAVVLYWLARDMTNDRYAGTVAALVFAFGTSAWSAATRALWTHAPSLLLLSLALWLAYRTQRRPKLAIAVAILLVLSYAMRPTNLLPLIAFAAYMLVAQRRIWPAYCVTSCACLGGFFALNWRLYGALLPWYYTQTGLSIRASVGSLQGLAGTLISPSRGLFIYSPVLLFALYGFYHQARTRRLGPLDKTAAGLVVAHWLLISFWHNWWGGHSYGPRLFSDMLPFLIYLMVPILPAILRSRERPWTTLRMVFVAAALVSFAMQLPGVLSWATTHWGETPVNVDTNPWRLWDWSDAPFFRW